MHDLCFAMFSAVFGYAVLVSVLSSGVTHLEFIYFVLVVLLPIIGTIISAKAP